MSKAAEVIAGLTGSAEFDSAGGFSLDREKARQKMRQFQLADPHRYVLLLVEAAALGGARNIRFDIDADDMHMYFDGEGLSWADLDELYTSLFVDRSVAGIRSRRQLALACNAVMALNPKFARIESFTKTGGEDGGPGGVRALLQPEAEDAIERLSEVPEALADGPFTTHIHVKERFRPGLFVRFLNDAAGSIPEELLLRERCAHSSLRILLDGVAISQGLPSALVCGVRFESETLRGVAGIHTEQLKRSAVVLLSNGVEIATHELGQSVPGMWYWVDSANFRKDVSQNDVVRSDPAYETMLESLAEPRDRVLARLVESWRDGDFSVGSTPTADHVFNLLRACFLRWGDHRWLRADAGPLGAFAELPLWRTTAGDWVNSRRIADEHDRERGIMYSTRDFGGVMPEGWGPVVYAFEGPGELEALTRVFPSARDVESELGEAVEIEKTRRRWRSRQHPPTLPRGIWDHPLSFSTDVLQGQLALRPSRLSEIRVVARGCLLCTYEFDAGFPGVCAVIEGPFPIRDDYAGPVLGREFAAAMLVLLAQLPRVLEVWARAEDARAQQVARPGLLALALPGFAEAWLEHFGWTQGQARRLLDKLGRPELMPSFGLNGEGDEPTAIARALYFRTVDSRQVTLAEIERERRTRERLRGKVLHVDDSAPDSVALAEQLLRADGPERALLRAIFGSEQLHDDTVDYTRNLSRRRFLARPGCEPTAPPTGWTVQVDHEGVRGFVNVNPYEVQAWRAREPRRARIQVIVDGRELCRIEESTWLPGVHASLRWDAAPVDDSWEQIAGSRAPLRGAVEHGLLELVRAQAERVRELGAQPDPNLRRLLWLVLASPFIDQPFYAAWSRFRAAHHGEPAAAMDRMIELLCLFPGVDLETLSAGIELAIEGEELPTAQRVLGITGARGPRLGAANRAFHRGVLELFELLEQLPMLATVSGQVMSLAELEAVRHATNEIAHVNDPALQYDGDDRTILRLEPIDAVALHRMFADEEFVDASAWIEARRHQQRFQAKAQLEQLRVPDRSRLVGVEFEEEGFAGELAVPPWMPGEIGRVTLTMCHDRRVVDELEISAVLPLVGIIDDERATLTEDYSGVDTGTARMAELRRFVGVTIRDRLMPALADRFTELEGLERERAWAWVGRYWAAVSRLGGQMPNRLDEAGRRFAELPGFTDVDGSPVSLAQLSERYQRERCIWYVEGRPPYDQRPRQPVLQLGPGDREILGDMFTDVADFSERWAAQVEGRRRRERAETLPATEAPGEPLLAAEVDRHDMRGTVWLPDRHPFDAGLILGAEGKVVSVLRPIEALPIQGVVDGITADDGFEQAQLSPAQRRYLEGRTVYLYSQLLGAHRHDRSRPEREGFLEAEAARRRSLRVELLRAAVIALAKLEQQHGEDGPGFDIILGNFYRRAREEPLLRLATGRLIALDVAVRARPQELSYLGLWDPNSPPLDAAERARLLLGEEAAGAPVREPAEADAEALAEQEPPAEPAKAPDFDDDDTSSGLEELAKLAGAMGFDEGDGDGELIDIRKLAAEIEGVELLELDEDPEDEVAGLLDRIRDELRLIRERDEELLDEGVLDAIDAEAGSGQQLVQIGDRVLFDARHPRFVRALEDPDPIWVSFLASTAYTALNHWLEKVSDEDELAFHGVHAELLLTGLLSEAEGGDEAASGG